MLIRPTSISHITIIKYDLGALFLFRPFIIITENHLKVMEGADVARTKETYPHPAVDKQNKTKSKKGA